MRSNRTRLLAVLCTLVLLVTASACSSSSTTAPAPVQSNMSTPADTFVLATAQDVPNLDLHDASANSAFRPIYVMYDRLVTYEDDSTLVSPMLATDWKISADGLTYTFKLRQDAKFHDGTSVNADAVKYTFDRIMGMGKMASGLFKGKVDQVSVLDEYTVEFTLLEPYAPFLSTLGTAWCGIVNPSVKQLEKDGDWSATWMNENVAGSGPYKLKSWTRGQEMVLEANNDWWGGKPTMQTVIIKTVLEPATRRLMVEKGEVDYVEGVSADVVDELKKVDGVTVAEVDSMGITYGIYNTEKAPFDNLKVRQAFSHAIPYQSIIEDVYNGYAIQGRTPIPKGMLGYSESVATYSTDMNKAKQLLQESGVGPIKIELTMASGFEDWENIALLWQAELATLGVEVEIKQYAWPTFLEKIIGGDFELSMVGWTPDYADPNYNMNYHLHSSQVNGGFNLSRWSSPQMDNLLEDARRNTDQKVREDLYKQAQDLAVANAPYAWFAQTKTMLPMRSWVKGFKLNPMNTWYVPFHKLTKQP